MLPFLLLLLLLIALVLTEGSTSSPALNPYTSGCLHHALPGYTKKRVCNSEDPDNAASTGLCREPIIPQLEIRIYGFGWDTAYFQGFLLQILLSELLDVPVTIESTSPDVRISMYDPEGQFEFASEGNAQRRSAFENAVKYDQDCTKASKDKDNYETCAHHYPELWNYMQGAGFTGWVKDGLDENAIEFPYSLGMVGVEGIFVTKYTISREPSILSYYGMVGQANRRKLAELFPRPWTWGEYCQDASANNCTDPDDVSTRAPATPEEYQRYFVDGLFTGYFQQTEEDDCDINPFTCTGHIAPYPCGWSSYAESLMYHNDIALKGGGKNPNMPHGGYTYQQQIDLFYAANATGANLIIEWWSPNQQSEMFRGTSFELVHVVFPYPTQECLSRRNSLEDICSTNQTIRVGDPIAACDEPPAALTQTVTTGLNEIILQQDEAIQSPAYAVLKRYLITEFKLSEVFQLGKNSSLTARDAACLWAVDNFDSFLLPLVPPSHPRTLQDTTKPIWNWICVSLGVFVCIVVVVTAVKVHNQQGQRAIRYAQIEFLRILLLGCLTLALGAIVVAAPPSDGTCILSSWLVYTGYNLILVPLIVKVAAINRLTLAASRMHRVTITRSSLWGATAIMSCISLIYLAIWTVNDPPLKTAEYQLTDTMISEPTETSHSNSEYSEDGYSEFTRNTVVNVSYYCSSNKEIWNFIGVAWNVLLLVCCTVLAIQTRKVRQEFNESQVLGILIYSHSAIALLMLVTFFLSPVAAASTLTKIQSILYSVDTLTTIVIYFIPKLYADTSFFRATLQINQRPKPSDICSLPASTAIEEYPKSAMEEQNNHSQNGGFSSEAASDSEGKREPDANFPGNGDNQVENNNHSQSSSVALSEADGRKDTDASILGNGDKPIADEVTVQMKVDRDLINQVIAESDISVESETILMSLLSSMEEIRRDNACLKERVKIE